MNKAMTALLGLITLPLAVSAYADVLSVHCPLGCPNSPPANDLVFTHTYALSNNPVTKFADWVAYEVDGLTSVNRQGRIGKPTRY